MARIDDLRAAQDLMWSSIAEADPDKRAPLMNQWRALEATLAELGKAEEKTGDPLDEIAARRTARGGSTARPGRTDRVSS